jgi:preprotein translocase subunit SecG
MEILWILSVIALVLVSGSIVYLVLMQEPKQGAGDLFGASSTDLFGARGVTGGLYRITVVLGIVFVVLAFAIGRIPR